VFLLTMGCITRESAIVAFIIFFIVYPPAMYLFFTSETFESWHCLGSPFLYVTLHDSENGPVKYTRDGCSLTGNVLVGFQVQKKEDFRSMAIGSDDSIFIVESTGKGGWNNTGSKILEYGSCDAAGMRHFKDLVLDAEITKAHGANHPYGIALAYAADGSVNQVYASFQTTDVVLRFEKNGAKDLWTPVPLPKALTKDIAKKHRDDDYYYPGTFYQFGKPGPQKHKNQGVRSINFVGENLWIADEKSDVIVIVDPQGYVITKLDVRQPIGLYYSVEHGTVFASSRSSYGCVYGYNATTFDVTQRYHTGGMTHPTGVVSYRDSLFVLEQAIGNMYSFDVHTGALQHTVLSGLKKQMLEQIVLSNC
jgi:hypothetical protein